MQLSNSEFDSDKLLLVRKKMLNFLFATSNTIPLGRFHHQAANQSMCVYCNVKCDYQVIMAGKKCFIQHMT